MRLDSSCNLLAMSRRRRLIVKARPVPAVKLPSGRLIVQVSKHLVAVIDNVIHDTGDCSLHGRCFVQGYFAKHVAGQGFRLVEG
jgi:hypothetical protein